MEHVLDINYKIKIMLIKKIEYLHDPLDSVNEYLDVFVALNDDYCTDGFTYLFEVTTPKGLSNLMEENNFVDPEYPYIIVSELTDQIIREAIQAFIDKDSDLFWLKLYHIIPSLNIEDINEILNRKKQEQLESTAKLTGMIDEE